MTDRCIMSVTCMSTCDGMRSCRSYGLSVWTGAFAAVRRRRRRACASGLERGTSAHAVRLAHLRPSRVRRQASRPIANSLQRFGRSVQLRTRGGPKRGRYTCRCFFFNVHNSIDVDVVCMHTKRTGVQVLCKTSNAAFGVVLSCKNVLPKMGVSELLFIVYIRHG